MTQTLTEPEPIQLALARSRRLLADRGIDPEHRVGVDDLGNPVTTADLHVRLGAVAASEKSGQAPTHMLARLALAAALPSETADTLFLAYNQQSAEEAGHGDKVFGNAYYAMGGCDLRPEQSAFRDVNPAAFQPSDDPKENLLRLCTIAGALGGIEVVALQGAFPTLVSWCEHWEHPVAHDLQRQIRDVVRPEESRHVLTWRYVFHQLIAPKGDAAIAAYLDATNLGRRTIGAPDLDHATLRRQLGQTAPTPRQLLGKERNLA